MLRKWSRRGLTIVPSKPLYLKHRKIKVELALGRGRKKLHDHRVELKRRAEGRDMQRAELARITAPSGSMTGRDASGRFVSRVPL